MIKIYDKIPKEYERVAIEEYFKFLNDLCGIRYLFKYPDFKYTSDKNKLSRRELKDELLMAAIDIVSLKKDNIKFVLSSLNNEHFAAIARVEQRDTSLHIPEIIYLEYPTSEEKIMFLSELLTAIDDYAMRLGIEMITYEVPKTDNVTLNYMLNYGWNLIDESSKETDSYKTYMLEKALTRELNESTRRRK